MSLWSTCQSWSTHQAESGAGCVCWKDCLRLPCLRQEEQWWGLGGATKPYQNKGISSVPENSWGGTSVSQISVPSGCSLFSIMSTLGMENIMLIIDRGSLLHLVINSFAPFLDRIKQSYSSSVFFLHPSSQYFPICMGENGNTAWKNCIPLHHWYMLNCWHQAVPLCVLSSTPSQSPTNILSTVLCIFHNMSSPSVE